mmetsp:Transcript_43454/g.94365  ORF Transcript_43454/g.94365 Transcript_43454/m.94365 type:complete len:99 (-) Transcript_43454:81-377(-)|eukprot:CAMPEP_0175805206 /NCGR_PEP_ID=MMETSP0107_2-20121207/531_1 /TAXON_ID=195067 ORGANISM="Goniomonas pacifica, Strain CCMP1869" /NCGR_SAMPLE_ID=MMETSP0107_2 /ASSEMBLY_ACC=CAM_ASM_000203 /LENGTH=98 /DNA_ID=CAMNT_0017116609 /DNA_START=42 /DNA_END=338 /DNA_ORIENTATION=+
MSLINGRNCHPSGHVGNESLQQCEVVEALRMLSVTCHQAPLPVTRSPVRAKTKRAQATSFKVNGHAQVFRVVRVHISHDADKIVGKRSLGAFLTSMIP